MTKFDRRGWAFARGVASVAAFALLAACGGGGGDGGEPAQSAPSSTPPTLSIQADATATTAPGPAIALHAAESTGTATPTWTLAGPGSLSATTGSQVTYLPPDGESLEAAATAVVTAKAGSLTRQVVISVAVDPVAGRHWDLARAPEAGATDGQLMSTAIVGATVLAAATNGTLLSSDDGQAWSSVALGSAAWPDAPRPFTAAAVAGTASGRRVVAGFVPADNGSVTPAVLYSDDGAAWRVASEPRDMFANVLLDDGARLLAWANGGVYASPDGSAWRLLSSIWVQNGQWVTGVAKGPAGYVAVGRGGLAATSPDAVQWTVAPLVLDAGAPALALDLNGVAWTGTRFVAVAANGNVATSPDGQHWHAVASATRRALDAIAVSPQGELVAVGDQGVIETSVDAVHWTLRAGPAAATLRALAFAGGRFVAVGDAGVVETSTH